jgi:predicted hydrocarbon binding protein
MRGIVKTPINKNQRWMASLHESLDQLDGDLKAAIMKRAGRQCAADLLLLCAAHLGKQVETIEELIRVWNHIRAKRDLKGKWEFEENLIRAIIYECSCPLVSSGLMQLHAVQCYCSLGMMETIFSQVAQKPVEVDLVRSIGRGDEVCEFIVKP